MGIQGAYELANTTPNGSRNKNEIPLVNESSEKYEIRGNRGHRLYA